MEEVAAITWSSSRTAASTQQRDTRTGFPFDTQLLPHPRSCFPSPPSPACDALAMHWRCTCDARVASRARPANPRLLFLPDCLLLSGLLSTAHFCACRHSRGLHSREDACMKGREREEGRGSKCAWQKRLTSCTSSQYFMSTWTHVTRRVPWSVAARTLQAVTYADTMHLRVINSTAGVVQSVYQTSRLANSTLDPRMGLQLQAKTDQRVWSSDCDMRDVALMGSACHVGRVLPVPLP